MKILDCTLRDGGYYNNWDFSPDIVGAYLAAMAEARIDYVELGLRNFPKMGFLGPFAYTTESFISRLDLPEGPIYGVMVDARTILTADLSVEEAVCRLFVHSNKSKIGLVRIAAHFHEVEESGSIVKLLKDMGYIVGFNLMQAGGKSDQDIAEKAKQVKEWGGVDVLYFADSLGNMDGKEVERVVKALRQNWDGEIGVHTHNNMAKALDNTLIAKNVGVSWLDVTVTGMGRGAGNAQTEFLLAVVAQDCDAYSASPVYELAIRYFQAMQHRYGWGSSLLYFLGAQNDVHPTYIQNLLSNSHYGTDEIVGAIKYLSNLEDSISYNGDVLQTALSFNNSNKPISGSDYLKDLFLNRELIIIGGGPSLERYLNEIESYILQYKPVVLAINTVSALSSKYIDFYCISHNSRFLSERGAYKKLGKPIILPKHMFADDELEFLSPDVEIIEYGLKVQANEFNVQDSFCTIPFEITTAYALAIAAVAAAQKISLIGFDGYERGDVRQAEMTGVLSRFKQIAPSQKIIALTPTTYPVEQGSIYAPIV